MKSPFPGMDPYLDRSWKDFGARCVVCARDHIQPALPIGLVARIQYADLEDKHVGGTPIARRWIAIHPVRNQPFVTILKFMTPLDMTNDGCRMRYGDVREELLQRSVNLVEVVLFRASSQAAYSARIHRPIERRVDVVPISLYEPLPNVPIPLRASDIEVSLNLQTLIQQTYESRGYDDIDYSRDPDPPLIGEDAIWADDLLRRLGKR